MMPWRQWPEGPPLLTRLWWKISSKNKLEDQDQ